ncbi:hypothetical protein BCON_0072g00060 [Botryotinia convoluta]|uniref:Uncharacterized protein n=1 Tax=Botryotinia convoluta TaxID=54673 RepID=A0A4Z1I5G7_9HELO|nr:hypothetical protein BCON_0072g00060 [Botryotinia convoluta]
MAFIMLRSFEVKPELQSLTKLHTVNSVVTVAPAVVVIIVKKIGTFDEMKHTKPNLKWAFNFRELQLILQLYTTIDSYPSHSGYQDV